MEKLGARAIALGKTVRWKQWPLMKAEGKRPITYTTATLDFVTTAIRNPDLLLKYHRGFFGRMYDTSIF